MNDLIRKQDAVTAISDLLLIQLQGKRLPTWNEVYHAIDDIPSVEPERKKGKWIEYPDCLRYEGAYADDQIVCSECHHVFSILDNCTEEFDFCPHCGAEMRGE